MILAGGPGSEGPGWGMVLPAGPRKSFCLVAAGIPPAKGIINGSPGKVRRASIPSDPSAQASRFRYYTGLAGCLFKWSPALPLCLRTLDALPGGAAKIGILVVADLVFFGSLFFAGGEFWGKTPAPLHLGRGSGAVQTKPISRSSPRRVLLRRGLLKRRPKQAWRVLSPWRGGCGLPGARPAGGGWWLRPSPGKRRRDRVP